MSAVGTVKQQSLIGGTLYIPDAAYFPAGRSHESKIDAYAVACIDESMQYQNYTARVSYYNLVQSWGLPGCLNVLDLFVKYKPEMRAYLRDKAKAIFRNEPIPNFPECIIDAGPFDNDDLDTQKHYAQVFVLAAFNKKREIVDNKPKVELGNSIHLSRALIQSSLIDFLEEHPELKGPKVITDMELFQFRLFLNVLQNKYPSRINRKIRCLLRNNGFDLLHFSKIESNAEKWYKSRVIYTGPEGYSRMQYKRTGIYIDPRNIDKDIKLCDLAVGYPRRG